MSSVSLKQGLQTIINFSYSPMVLSFFPDGKNPLNAILIWNQNQKGFLWLAWAYKFFMFEGISKFSLLYTINRSIHFSEGPMCFVLPLSYKLNGIKPLIKTE